MSWQKGGLSNIKVGAGARPDKGRRHRTANAVLAVPDGKSCLGERVAALFRQRVAIERGVQQPFE